MKKLLWIALTVILGNVHVAMATQDHNHGDGAGKIDFSLIGNGYFVTTPIDLNQDGTLASHMSLSGKSKELGKVSVNVLAEIKVALDENKIPKSCVTPDGDQGISLEIVKANGIFQLKNGDQFFTEGTSFSLCISMSKCFDEEGKIKAGCTFQPVATAKIIGGTGKFSCASGRSADEHIRTVLAIDPRGETFGSAAGFKIHGTINTVSSCDK